MPGPPPKDPRKRARVNADPIPVRCVENRAIPQPALTDILGEVNSLTGQPWSVPTLDLWESLRDFPTTANLQRAQWSLLARAMLLDDLVMRGNKAAMAEQRMQLAKFGVAPDDVARLRIFFADADEKDERAAERAARKKTTESPARSRYGGLKAVND